MFADLFCYNMRMKRKKIIYIPGWMDKAEYSGFFPGLDIWGSKIDYRKRIDTDVIVAHSLGCHFALLNWQQHKNTKLILVNPVFEKKSLMELGKKWLKFLFSEGAKQINPRRVVLFFHFFLKLPLSLFLLKSDIKSLLISIPRENIFVLRGKNDNHLCSAGDLNFFVENNIKFIEIDDMGHVWKKEKIEDIIKKIIYDNRKA